MKSKPSYFSIRALTSGDSASATRLRNSPSVFILSTNPLALSIDMSCSLLDRGTDEALGAILEQDLHFAGGFNLDDKTLTKILVFNDLVFFK